MTESNEQVYGKVDGKGILKSRGMSKETETT